MSVDKEYSILCVTEKPLKEYIHVEVVIQYIMGSPGWKLNIIPLHILIVLLHLKCCSTVKGGSHTCSVDVLTRVPSMYKPHSCILCYNE